MKNWVFLCWDVYASVSIIILVSLLSQAIEQTGKQFGRYT